MMIKKRRIDTEKVNIHIVQWLKEYAVSCGAKGFVIGISGGVDSALTSTLCAQTGLEVLCVEMPIHQHQSHLSRAAQHIMQLKQRFSNVQSVYTDLTPTFEIFKTAVTPDENNPKTEITLANTRARLRMSTLYFYAGTHGLLVAGTGNKVEDFGVGFYTKYGDGGVDLSPIADLMKSEVFELAAYLQVPQSILDAQPSDGLYGNEKTDEDQLGASYDELEWAMLVEEQNLQQTDFTEREKVVFDIYKKLNTANKHKMVEIPVCKLPN
jgi:NAD+ synthase